MLNRSAVVKVRDAKGFRTGWVCSSKGYVLTAGHGLVAGEACEIEFAGLRERRVFPAVVLECSSDPDYALLQLLGTGPHSVQPLSVKTLSPRRIAERVSDFSSYGYSALNPRGSDFVGAIAGIYGSGSGSRLRIERSTAEPGDGWSGSPIAIGKTRGTFQEEFVVALYIGEITRANNVATGESLLRICEASPRVERLLCEGSFLRAVLSLGERDRGPSFEPVGEQRFTVLLTTEEPESRGNRLRELIAQQWNSFEEAVRSNYGRLRSLPHLRPKLPQLARISLEVSAGPQTIDVVLASVVNQAGETNLPLVRAILDLDAAVDFDEPRPNVAEVVRPVESSHLIGIQLCTSASLESGGTASCVDCCFLVPDASDKRLINRVLRILHDLFLDCAVFNAAPILSFNFSSPSSRREFSRIKLGFIDSRGLTVYGRPSSAKDPDRPLDYASLASVCRADIDAAEFNSQQYERLWREFVGFHLFTPPVVTRGALGCYPSGELCPRITGEMRERFPKLAGQIPWIQQALDRRYNSNSPPQEGELCAIAVARRRPKQGSHRKSMAGFFAKTRWHRGMSRVYRAYEFRELSRWNRYCAIIYFRWIGPEQESA